MRVIGIDPGTRHCGWGVVEARPGSRVVHVAHGVVSPPARAALEDRLVAIHAGLVQAIATHRPQAAAVEQAFFSVNAQTALVLGQGRGVALLAAAQAGLAVHSYAPTVVKQAVVGTGRADKEQVARMLRLLLGVTDVERTDATDALAVALTHATRGGFQGVHLGNQRGGGTP